MMSVALVVYWNEGTGCIVFASMTTCYVLCFSIHLEGYCLMVSFAIALLHSNISMFVHAQLILIPYCHNTYASPKL